ncbi:Testis-expressed sequence 10 protein, partial [Orchesella cincta]
MAKSSRHKKLRKQEKAKTQLTGVKKLSKPQNVVEPTLRVKKILIREQLKTSSLPLGGPRVPSSSSSVYSSVVDDDEELTTRRKQSIQDLLSTVNHHNTNLRKDAVVGLQEIASIQITTIVRHLDKILAKIASLTSDEESSVRKENLKLAEIVFSKVTDNQLRPFWSMLVAHLKCTLTHLTPSVRYNALLFIELLIQHYPGLVIESCSAILPSVLSLISTTYNDRNTNTSSSKKKPGSVTRLKVEISGKHSDMTERLKVLKLLGKCIGITSTNFKRTDGAAGLTSRYGVAIEPSEYLSLRYPFGYCWDQIRENELKEAFPGGYSMTSYESRLYSSISLDPFSSNFSSNQNEIATNFWYGFVTSCVSVLIETWVELGTSSQKPGNSNADKRGTKKFRQAESIMIGNDKEGANSNIGRRNGFHILNESTVDSLLCIATLFELIFQRNGIIAADEVGNTELEDQMIKDIKKAQGQNIAKHFFHLMPYVSLNESRRRDVTNVNLKMFLIAGRLKMFDSSMKKKLQIFTEGVIDSAFVDREQCKIILNILSFIEGDRAKLLSTNFLIYASKI